MKLQKDKDDSKDMSLPNELFLASRAWLRDGWSSGRLFKQLSHHERFDRQELERIGQQYLHGTLQCAIKAIPYYSHISAKFTPSESTNVLTRHFPIIDKTHLLANTKTLYPNSGEPRPWWPVGKTSGTTGTPLAIHRSYASISMEQAFFRRHWSWAGFYPGMKRATLRGDFIVPIERNKPPFWVWNRFNNQLVLSSRHLQEAHVDAILDELERFGPQMLQAYPSTAFTLATFLARRNRYLSIPLVFTASEPLYLHQRELLVERLQCKVMDMYGMAERVAFATECEQGEIHINPDYSYVEIVGDDGLPTNGYGYVVGTTFHNLTMPLVRYRVTDRTRWKPGVCRCGRAFPMIEPVTGKFEDLITGGSGAPVSGSVLTFAFKGLKHIQRSQVAQVDRGRWEVRLVPTNDFSADDGIRLVDNIRKLVDSTIRVDVVLKTALPDTASGKFRWVVNEMRDTGER